MRGSYMRDLVARSRMCSGFSLIELLVVISIISILFSLLSPALKKARNAAGDISCLSNVKNISIAGQLYQMDNEAWIYPPFVSNSIITHPYDANWRLVFYWNYLNQNTDVFRCPRIRRGAIFNIHGNDHEQYVDKNAPGVSVYGINIMWNRWNGTSPDTWRGWSQVRISQVKRPSGTVAFSGGINGNVGIQGEYPPGHILMTVGGDTGWIDFTRHDNRTPVAFVDGHTRFVEHENLFNINEIGPERWYKFLAWY
jgi:prepilin-type N-terminal cleavage/methylation domain-containing protein/prepilin-type processing-associated H-X9-DG protein